MFTSAAGLRPVMSGCKKVIVKGLSSGKGERKGNLVSVWGVPLFFAHTHVPAPERVLHEDAPNFSAPNLRGGAWDGGAPHKGTNRRLTAD